MNVVQFSPGLTTFLPDGAVRLRDSSGQGSLTTVPPLSVPSLLRQAAERNPDGLALAVKRDGEWMKWNYEQYNKVRKPGNEEKIAKLCVVTI